MITPRRPPAGGAVARHYDELDPFYRAVWGEHVHHGLFRTGGETVPEATEALVELVAERAGVGPGDRVVDVGCGYGGTARWLARRGAVVTGLTVSRAQAEEAARLWEHAADGTAPEILVRDWLENGLDSDAFDIALAIESTTHMPDRQRVFDELARVLRPGGRLVACVWCTSDAPRPWEVRHLLEPICHEGRLHGMGSIPDNRAWIESAGLRLLSVEDLSRQVRTTWTRVLGRVGGRLLRDPAYRRFLLDRSRTERVFAASVPRLWLGYRTGALRYGLFVAEKPASLDVRAT